MGPIGGEDAGSGGNVGGAAKGGARRKGIVSIAPTATALEGLAEESNSGVGLSTVSGGPPISSRAPSRKNSSRKSSDSKLKGSFVASSGR